MRDYLKMCAVGALLGVTLPTLAWAGPCSDDIAKLSKTLNDNASLGGSATTGTLTGKSASSAANPNSKDLAKGTTADGKVGGDAGSKEVNAVAGQTATSPEDVRRQQAGVPTAANAPGTKTPDENISLAKAELDKARALDAKEDTSCAASVSKARQLAHQS